VSFPVVPYICATSRRALAVVDAVAVKERDVAAASAVCVSVEIFVTPMNAEREPIVLAATVTVHVLAVETGAVVEPVIDGVTRIVYVPAFVGVKEIVSVFLRDAAAAAETLAVRAVDVSTVGVPRSVSTAVIDEKATSDAVIPAGAASYDKVSVIESEVVSCRNATVASTVTAVPTVVEPVAAERLSESA
jgi:hypothetical protein